MEIILQKITLITFFLTSNSKKFLLNYLITKTEKN